MSSETYNECLKRLLSLHSVKRGLNNTRELTELLGDPQETYKTVHIAGTCGKGSVAHKIAQCLMLKGYKVGLFTSPHICSFRERIRVNDDLISESQVISYFNQIIELVENNNIQATFFEICTIMAFLHFSEIPVDYAVIEAGLGGEFDPTNIIEHPICTVITSIGFDHMAILGDTYEKICKTKSGIFKPGCSVVLGPSAAVHKVFHERACDLDCEVFSVSPEPRGETIDEENKRIAAEVIQCVLRLEFLQSELRVGLMKKLPLRMKVLDESEMDRALRRCKFINPSVCVSTSQTATNNIQNEHNKIKEKHCQNIDHVNKECSTLSSPECKSSKLDKFSHPNESSYSFLPHAIVVDVAHNEHAFSRLCQEIGFMYYGMPIRACVCLSKERYVGVLQPFVNHFHYPKNNRLKAINYIEAEGWRIKSVQAVLEELKDDKVTPELKSYILNGVDETNSWIKPEMNKNQIRKKFREMLSAAVQKSCEEKSVLVISGTFYMMKETLQCLDFSIGPVDTVEVNEISNTINEQT